MNIGQHSDDELAARLQAATTAINATRREALVAWVRHLELLLVEVQSRLEQGHAALATAQQRYRAEFGLGSRLNPFDQTRRQYRAKHIEPLTHVVAADSALMHQCDLLLTTTRAAAAPLEWRTSYQSGIAGVYNQQTGQAEWMKSYQSGVAGVWNPTTRQIEWMKSYQSGVAGAWNPTTRQVEWQKRYQCGVACLAFDGTAYVSSGSYYGHDD